MKKNRPDYLPCAFYMREEKKITAGHHLIGKHVVMVSAWPDFKEVVENRLSRLKQTPSNLHDPDIYRVIPFDLVYKRITTIKTQGFIIVRKLFIGDKAEHIRPELARAYKTKQLILSLWEGYNRKAALSQVRKCRICGCIEEDCSQCIEKTGKPCHWVEEDLCSACKL